MKWTYNGIECNGTVEEYLQFLAYTKKVDNKTSKDTNLLKEDTQPTKIIYYGKHWTPEEDNIITNTTSIDDAVKKLPGRTRIGIVQRRVALKHEGKQLANLKGKTRRKHTKTRKARNTWTKTEDNIIIHSNTLKEAHKQLPHRTKCSISTRKHQLKKTGIIVQRYKTRYPKRTTLTEKQERFVKSPANIERMRFLGQRARWYMTQYNWNRDKSWQQAGQDYKNGKKPIAETRPTVYELIRWIPTIGKVECVDTFSNWEDAKNKLEECKTADLTIGEEYQYAIIKK